MSIAVVCPGCDADYSVPENLTGKTIRCKKCGETIAVKAAKAARVRVPADDEDDRPRKAAPRRRFEEDDDDRPQRRPEKKGLSPLLIGLAAALLLAASAGGAYMVFKPDNGENKQPVASNENGNPNDNAEKKPEEKKPEEKKPDEPKSEEKKADEKKPDEPKTEEKKPDEKKPEEKKPDEKKPTTPPKKEDVKPGGLISTSGIAVQPGGYETGLSRSDYRLGDMSPLVLSRVKAASVFIECHTENSMGWGSGWFGIEPGIVFTNAHVLHMTAPNAPKPKKLKFFLNSGTPTQRVIENANIEILAVDRDIDIACLRVNNVKDLPNPLKVRPSSDCSEGLGLNTIGYPFAYLPQDIMARAHKEPEVSVRRTTITAFRHNLFGILRRVQVEGAANPGNSGGPVVDAEGSVCCVIVEGVHRGGGALGGVALTGCVPTEYCFALLAGRVAETEFGMPYKAGSKVRVPIRVICQDPFDRLKKVGVYAWTGNTSTKYRAPGHVAPKTEPGDANRSDVTLTVDPKTKVASGELEFPELGAGAVYWAQPYFENAIYARYHEPGIMIPMTGPPADRVPAVLAYKPKIGTTRTVTLADSSDLSENAEGEGETRSSRVLIRSGLRVKEVTQAPAQNDPIQAAKLVLQFDELEMPKAIIGTGGQEEDLVPKSFLAILNKFIKQAGGFGLVNKNGQVYKHSLNVLNIPDPRAAFFTAFFTASTFEALEFTSIKMPEGTGEVQPNQSWQFDREEKVEFVDQVQVRNAANPNQVQVKSLPPRIYRYLEKWDCKYVGTRERNGVKEAVIEVNGKIVRASGSKHDTTGFIKGRVFVELDTGVVLDAVLEKELEVDTSERGIKKNAAGLWHFRLTRSATN